MSSRKNRKKGKEYKTPQAVEDFMEWFRKDAIQTLRNDWGSGEQVKAMEKNLERLQEFLMARCDTIRPPTSPKAPEGPSEPQKGQGEASLGLDPGEELEEPEEPFLLFPGLRE